MTTDVPDSLHANTRLKIEMSGGKCFEIDISDFESFAITVLWLKRLCNQSPSTRQAGAILDISANRKAVETNKPEIIRWIEAGLDVGDTIKITMMPVDGNCGSAASD